MNTSKGWTIGRKLLAAFLLVSTVTMIIGAVGVYSIQSGTHTIDRLGTVTLPSVDALLTIKEGAENVRGTLRTLGIPGLPIEIRTRQYDNLATCRAKYEAAWKTYESFPQTTDQAQAWKQFADSWNGWRAENNKYIETCRQFDSNGIDNPAELARQLERFTKDHYTAVQRVLHLLNMENAAFEGADDHTSCNAGKWIATFKTDNPQLAALVKGIGEPHREFHAAVKQIKQLVSDGKRDDAEAVYRERMMVRMSEVFKQFDGMLAIANSSLDTLAAGQQRLLGSVTDQQRSTIALLDKIIEGAREDAARSVSDARTRARMLETFSLIAAIAGVIAAMTLGLIITRGINRNLTRIATQLGEGADQVGEASQQVAAASQQLAEGASEQASSLEETSSALEEMAAMTRTNASNAKEANDLAGQARRAADAGDESMGQLNVAMTGINESSEKIRRIIKVIEEIAFQTNLLALNAAVEAARAGEHGKGFAVVADEVRNLAQRAAQAAKETTGLIEDATSRARQGTEVATEVGKSLGTIVSQAARVSDLIAAITSASDEQAQGVEQVNTAVSQMDKVTQQTASVAEESASAAEQLAAQAQAVKGMVGELVAMVGGTDSSARRTADPASPKAGTGTPQIAQAAIKKRQPALKPAGPTGKQEDYLGMDDPADLADF